MTHNPNDTVTIYEDPISQQKSEGQAKLIQKIIGNGGVVNAHGHMEYWLVEFLSDQEQVCRWVRTNNGGKQK